MKKKGELRREPQMTMDDIALAAAIAAALQTTLHLSGVTVNVSHRAVTLEGETDSEQERSAAEAVARRLCSNVTNTIRLNRRC